ncbi:MAG TPA: MAPEG family protein [Allosphingosinicella sp.]|nr:MAPEG family protein [Allosphingosinicella sp.]
MDSPILQPVVALVAWSLVMMIWMVVTRFAALKRHGISLKGRVGSKTGTLDGVVEDQVMWKAHNYNHLMEQPTLFYAVALVLAVTGHGDGPNAWIAWAYVALRVVHSLIQATTNVVSYRFVAWLLSSIALIMLTVHAAMAVCRHI